MKNKISKWGVLVDFSGDVPRWDVFRKINYNPKTRKYLDIEIYPKSPILGYESELEAWAIANELNGVKQ